MTTAETIKAFMASHELTVKAEFVPFSKSRNAGNKDRSLNWRVTLLHKDRAVLTTDYSAGVAHCPGYKQGLPYGTRQVIEYETENGRRGIWSESFHRVGPSGLKNNAIVPKPVDVLYSLVLDSNVLENATYEDWAAEYGFEPDSRKGEAIYRACLETALRLHAGLGGALLAAAREAVQDY